MLLTDRRGGALGLLGVGLLTLAGAAQAQDTERYVRAKEGAQARVFQDANAKAVGTLAAGDLLRVHREDVFDLPDGRRLTWLEVSSPQGFPVWVFGQYLAPTGAKGVVAVTGDAVRMRPLPESSVTSYPLRTNLGAGERLQVIERADPSRPLEQDWVHVWSPPSARAFVLAGDTTRVQDAATARAAWARSLRVLPAAAVAPTVDSTQPVDGGARPAARPPARDVPEEAYRSLAYGNTLLENARKRGAQATEADFAPAIRAYDVVLGLAPAKSQVAASASYQRDLAQTLQEVAGLRDEVAATEVRNQARLAQLQREQHEQQLGKSAGWGRFMGRGWVEPVTHGKRTRWFLRWAGDVVYEIECGSGRYDLSQFAGYQVGVMGSALRAASPSTAEQQGEVAMLDVSRIEVIQGGRR